MYGSKLWCHELCAVFWTTLYMWQLLNAMAIRQDGRPVVAAFRPDRRCVTRSRASVAWLWPICLSMRSACSNSWIMLRTDRNCYERMRRKEICSAIKLVLCWSGGYTWQDIDTLARQQRQMCYDHTSSKAWCGACTFSSRRGQVNGQVQLMPTYFITAAQ